MKDIKAVDGKKKTVKLTKSDLAVSVPKDFVFLLMDKIVDELSTEPLVSGDAAILSHPDIDLSEVKKAVRKRDLRLLLEATSTLDARSISSSWHNRPEIAFGLYQIHALLKKYPLTGDDCQRAAYTQFVYFEKHCKRFNTENYKAILALNEKHPDYLGIIEEIRADIKRCIGGEPHIEGMFDNAKHGPGSAIGSDEGHVTSFFKWSDVPYTVSPKALPLAREAIASDPRWIGALLDLYRTRHFIPMHAPIRMAEFWDWLFEVCDYCRYSTVPKSAVTDRSIGIEPKLNVYLQLGVDGLIRKALKYRWGIDLNTQFLNQKLAMESSASDEDATIDLRGASDCVSLMACYLLLPESWLALLLDLRSENIQIGERYAGCKTTLPLSKISAMGNGFTFVLESLIFAAIARATMRRKKIKGNLAIFGDDIIVPKEAAPFLIDLLNLFGFEINVDKTFVEGPFRESCGVDCLNGTNIRPFFLKKPVETVMDIWYVHNSLFVLERRLPELWEVSFAKTRAWLRRYIPRGYRDCAGPPCQALDSYLFVQGTGFDLNGMAKHKCIVSRPINFSSRAPDFLFRKLMAPLRQYESATSQARLEEFAISKIFGIATDLQSGWKTGGTVYHNMRRSSSCFDVTIRGVVVFVKTTRLTWKV